VKNNIGITLCQQTAAYGVFVQVSVATMFNSISFAGSKQIFPYLPTNC